MRSLLVTLLILGVVSCVKPPKAEPAARVALHRVGGTTFELVPAEGQHPYCLAFTVNAQGLIRQLTMTHANVSFSCPAGKPVAGHAYKVPLAEGAVKIYVFFTSQKVNAGEVAQEILESADRQAVNALNLRLPGNVTLETLDFTPSQDEPPEMGHLLLPDGGAADAAPDAGQP